MAEIVLNVIQGTRKRRYSNARCFNHVSFSHRI